MLNSKKIDYVLLFLFWTALTLITIYYLNINKTPLTYDAAAYCEISGLIGHQLHGFHFIKAFEIFIHHNPWGNRPGLYMFIGGFFAVLSNFNIELTVLFSNMFWFGLLIWFTYNIAQSCYGKGGILSAFMLITSYGVILMYRNFLLDIPLTVGVLFSLISFVKYWKHEYSNSKDGVIFYGSLIIGALLKETFVLYAFPIFLYHLLSIYKFQDKNSLLKQFMRYYLIVMAIVLLFYVPLLSQLIKNMVGNVTEEVGKYYARSFDKSSVAYYLAYFYLLSSFTSIYFVIMPIFFYALDLLIRYTNKIQITPKINECTILLCVVCIVPVIILTVLVVDTDARFILPILPIILILMSNIINSVKYIVLKTLCVICILLIGIVNFTTSVKYVYWLPGKVTYEHFILFSQEVFSEVKTLRFGFTSSKQDWKTREILETLMALSGNKYINIANLTSMWYLSTNTLRAYSSFKDANLNIYDIDINTLAGLEDAQYIITTNGKLTNDPKLSINKLNNINEYIFRQIKNDKYQIIQKYSLPNGDNVYIIKNQKNKSNE